MINWFIKLGISLRLNIVKNILDNVSAFAILWVNYAVANTKPPSLAWIGWFSQQRNDLSDIKEQLWHFSVTTLTANVVDITYWSPQTICTGAEFKHKLRHTENARPHQSPCENVLYSNVFLTQLDM